MELYGGTRETGDGVVAAGELMPSKFYHPGEVCEQSTIVRAAIA